MRQVGLKWWSRLLSGGVLAGIAAAVGYGLSVELQASPLQSRMFSKLAAGFDYHVADGASDASRFPSSGPYDERLGYSRLPEAIAALRASGYVVDRQARLSPGLAAYVGNGGFAIYPEKSQAGLSLSDRGGEVIYQARHPEWVFANFAAIPPAIVGALLFIENRELLDARFPTRNPAVEWDRFALAAANAIGEKVGLGDHRFGGSTLATQIEKFRHSPDGRTSDVADKLRQIVAASLRAYRDGGDTSEARRRIITDYINATPLAARPGFGEVIGLGDGLWAWYGTDLATARRVLITPPATPAEVKRLGQIYKQVLSLFIAQRRPSHYLIDGRNDLEALTDTYLRLMAAEGLLQPQLRDAALQQKLAFRAEPPPVADPGSFLDRKAINAIRAHLLGMLKVPSFYDLDRVDLRVAASTDSPTQQRVVDTLAKLTDPKQAEAAGLFGERLLGKSSASELIYSITLFERGEGANYLRVQADNLNRPFDLNEGSKFDLGSTAKLRTLVTYLEIVAELHRRYADLPRPELADIADDAEDPLTRWAAEYLAGNSDHSLQGMLGAAMQRKYSASPGEAFFTGRGLHSFANFDKTQNSRNFPVWEAFRLSNNLVFIRIMRDVVRFYQAEGPSSVKEILADPDHPSRRQYLERFADMEGKVFLARFWKRYKDLNSDAALQLIASRSRPAAHRLATVYLSVRPQASLAEFTAFIRSRLAGEPLADKEIYRLYAGYGPDKFNLQDRGYISRLHPLELWLVHYLQDHPRASWQEVAAASSDHRQDVYAWLFKSNRQGAANSRIRVMLEEDAFVRIHASWQRLGYPFASLVPSLATAIGTSGDRPASLAELIGIILNDGVRQPTIRIPELHFAEGTPYETHLSRPADGGERLLASEVAATVRRGLMDVVANGTAKRASNAFVDANGKIIPVGGKTGTGDELADRYRAGSAAAKARDVSRSAAFVFFVGDRFFGVVTAHVPGADASRYHFTSALPTQVLKVLASALTPLINGTPPAARQIAAHTVKVIADADRNPNGSTN